MNVVIQCIVRILLYYYRVLCCIAFSLDISTSKGSLHYLDKPSISRATDAIPYTPKLVDNTRAWCARCHGCRPQTEDGVDLEVFTPEKWPVYMWWSIHKVHYLEWPNWSREGARMQWTFYTTSDPFSSIPGPVSTISSTCKHLASG